MLVDRMPQVYDVLVDRVDRRIYPTEIFRFSGVEINARMAKRSGALAKRISI